MTGQRPIVVSLGEVLWDVFPDGPRFGGAPANLACHAAALGADATMVSCVGDDPLGKKALATLQDRGVKTGWVGVRADQPTGKVTVELDAAGVPSYTIEESVAWDYMTPSDSLTGLAARAEAVCFGTLGQRCDPSRHTIRDFVALTPASALRVLDVNLRAPYFSDPVIVQSLELANVLKLSDEELDAVAAAAGVAGSEPEILEQLTERYGLRLVALTRGDRGARLAGLQGLSDCAGVPTEVIDTVGAGDAFTAVMILGLLGGDDLDTINQRACRIASYVCSQAGATPALPTMQ